MGKFKNFARSIIVGYLPLESEYPPKVTRIDIRQLGIPKIVIVNRRNA